MASDLDAVDALASSNQPLSAFNKTIKPPEDSPAADEGMTLSLAGFFTLPRELQLRIVELACHAPTHAYHTGPLSLDASGAMDLLCLSRYFHDLVAPILLAHIRVTSSSALLSLHKALLAKPERGRLVRSLHLGPTNTLPQSHWPLKGYEDESEDGQISHDRLFVAMSLNQIRGSQRRSSSSADEELASRWQELQWEVSLDQPSRQDGCRGQAIHAALRAASRGLDVDPYRPSYGESGRKIGEATWCKRIFELRAALDLYLIAMRRPEDGPSGYDCSYRREESTAPAAPECQAGTCAHRYPKLVLDEYGTTHPEVASQASPDIFRLSPRQIARHLSQPYAAAMTDRFDHPLIFARTGYPLRDSDIGGEGQEKIKDLLLGKNLPDYWLFTSEEESDDEGPNFGPEGGALAAGEAHGPPAAHTGPQVFSGDAFEYLREIARPSNASEEVLTSTETLGGLLALARTVMSQTPNVSNLSLTGIFHRLLCSRQFQIGSDALRCLSIGPFPPYWTKTFTSKAMSRFPNLQRLRVGVPALTLEEIEIIAGEGLGLPRLEVVQWETMYADDRSTISKASLQSFVDLYHRLKGLVRVSAPPSLPNSGIAASKRKQDGPQGSKTAAASGHAEEPRQHTPTPSRRSRSITLMAHPRALHGIFEKILTHCLLPEEEKEGQRSVERGEAARQHFHISESKVPQTLLDDPSSEAIVNHLYASSKRWWEESAFYCGFRGWGR